MNLKEIASVMDPVRWPKKNPQPISVLALVRCHRWLGGKPPAPVSIKSISDRHSNPLTTRHRFLSYNTFLLQPTIDLPALVDALFSIEDLLAASNEVAEDLLNPLNITKDFILKTFGISEAEFITAKILVLGPAAAVPAAANLVLKIIGKTALQVILKGMFTPSQVLKALNIDLSFNVKGKPALDLRAVEIADQLLVYDVVALCELWHENLRQKMFAELTDSPLQRAPLTDAPRQISAVIGPEVTADDPLGETSIGSGLCVIALDRQVVQPEEPAPLVFVTKGVTRPVAPPEFPFTKDLGRFVDSDLWAKKGVLLTHLEAGPGMTVEVYNTHLYSGGDLIGKPFDDFMEFCQLAVDPIDVNGEESFHVRMAQVDEFLGYFSNPDVHHEGNVAILVGDFNVDAFDQRTFADERFEDPATGKPMQLTMYQALTKRLGAIGFDDAWLTFGKNSTNGLVAKGFTHDSDDVDEGKLAHEKVCTPSSVDSHFCDDDVEPEPVGSRYDYIFVQQPQVPHTFNLDLSRIRRRAFERDVPTDGMRFLSDHLGLDVTLIVSPKP